MKGGMNKMVIKPQRIVLQEQCIDLEAKQAMLHTYVRNKSFHVFDWFGMNL